MILHRPQPPKPRYRTKFFVWRRLGDWLVIFGRVAYLYEESEDHRRWTITWRDANFHIEEPLLIEHGDIYPDC